MAGELIPGDASAGTAGQRRGVVRGQGGGEVGEGFRVRLEAQAQQDVARAPGKRGEAAERRRKQETNLREAGGGERVRGGGREGAGDDLEEARGAFEGEHASGKEGEAPAIVVDEEEAWHQTFISTRISLRPMKT